MANLDDLNRQLDDINQMLSKITEVNDRTLREEYAIDSDGAYVKKSIFQSREAYIKAREALIALMPEYEYTRESIDSVNAVALADDGKPILKDFLKDYNGILSVKARLLVEISKVRKVQNPEPDIEMHDLSESPAYKKLMQLIEEGKKKSAENDARLDSIFESINMSDSSSKAAASEESSIVPSYEGSTPIIEEIKRRQPDSDGYISFDGIFDKAEASPVEPVDIPIEIPFTDDDGLVEDVNDENKLASKGNNQTKSSKLKVVTRKLHYWKSEMHHKAVIAKGNLVAKVLKSSNDQFKNISAAICEKRFIGKVFPEQALKDLMEIEEIIIESTSLSEKEKLVLQGEITKVSDILRNRTTSSRRV